MKDTSRLYYYRIGFVLTRLLRIDRFTVSCTPIGKNSHKLCKNTELRTDNFQPLGRLKLVYIRLTICPQLSQNCFQKYVKENKINFDAAIITAFNRFLPLNSCSIMTALEGSIANRNYTCQINRKICANCGVISNTGRVTFSK